MSKETTGKPARMSIPGRSVDDTNQPPQTIMAGSENDENLKTLDEELQEKLGKIFNSKPVWNQIRKQLEDKGEIPSPDIQNVDSIEALFRVLKEHNKIKPWDYAFLQYILVRFKDDKTETRKLISDYTAKIPSETEETKPKKTGNHKKQVDGTPQPPQSMLAASSQSNENILGLHEELQQELSKIFTSKGQRCWKKIRKLLLEKKIPKTGVQNVDSITALFTVLTKHKKIDLGDYGFLRDILVRYVDDDTETRTIITNYTAKICYEKEGKLQTDGHRTDNDTDQGQSSSPSETKRQRTEN